MRIAFERAGRPELTTHAFRKSVASLMAERITCPSGGRPSRSQPAHNDLEQLHGRATGAAEILEVLGEGDASSEPWGVLGGAPSIGEFVGASAPANSRFGKLSSMIFF